MRWFAYAPAVVLAVWAVVIFLSGIRLVEAWLLLIALAVVIQVTELRRRYRNGWQSHLTDDTAPRERYHHE